MATRLAAFILTLTATSLCIGQDAPQLAEQPVLIVRFNGWSSKGFEDYIRELNNDLQVGKNIAEAIEKGAARNQNTDEASSVQAPASGFLVYLVKGLIPSTEQIQFAEVGSQEEFEKLVRTQYRSSDDAASAGGSSARLEGEGAKRKYVQTVVSRTEILDASVGEATAEPGDVPVKQVSSTKTSSASTDSTKANTDEVEEAEQTRVMIGPLGFSSSSVQNDGEIVEENGHKFREHKSKITTWLRYHDGFIFTGTSKAVWEMTPPTSELLREQNNTELNGHLAFYPDRIPEGFRQLAWNALNTTVGTELQQGDNESSEDYLMRRTSGEAGLGLIQAAMFDTQEVSAWMKFATGDEPLRGELKIDARNNSNLGRSLREFASANGRFAPILKDDAAATIHIAINLSNEWKSAVEALRTSFIANLDKSPDATNNDMRELIQSLTSSASHGTVEAMIKLGWSKESGGVIYGGIHVDENAALLSSFRAVANSDDSGYEFIRKGDLQLLMTKLPDDYQSDSVRLTHAYLAHVNSCLWFAVGGENAFEMIRQSVERCADSSGRTDTPMLTTAIDFETLLTYPQDDATGLTSISHLCISQLGEVVGAYTGFGAVADTEGQPETSSSSDLAFRAMQLGGSKKLSLTIDADESGLVARGTLGNALLRAILAPAIGSIDERVTLPEPTTQETTTATTEPKP